MIHFTSWKLIFYKYVCCNITCINKETCHGCWKNNSLESYIHGGGWKSYCHVPHLSLQKVLFFAFSCLRFPSHMDFFCSLYPYVAVFLSFFCEMLFGNRRSIICTLLSNFKCPHHISCLLLIFWKIIFVTPVCFLMHYMFDWFSNSSVHFYFCS